MNFSKDDLLYIAAKASSMDDRQMTKVGWNRVKGKEAENEIQKKLKKWCKVVAKGDPEMFAKRLRWAGLDKESAKKSVGPVQIDNDCYLPAWVDTLEHIFRIASPDLINPNKMTSYQFLTKQEPVAFEHLWVPMIMTARQKLQKRAGSLYALLTESAHAETERTLLKQLAGVGWGVFNLEFSSYRSITQRGDLAHILSSFSSSKRTSSRQNETEDLYDRFIHKMYHGELLSLFKEYNVLAKLIAIRIDFWVNSLMELLQRFARDQKQIGEFFFEGQQSKQISALKGSVSDFHSGGQAVMILTFTDGNRLVYKPKNLGLDVTFFQLLAWLEKQGAPIDFKQTAILERRDYGWVEYIEHHPCQKEAEVSQFYERAGGLLCLLHLFEGTDCHFENIISDGGHPVLIDLETIVYPRIKLTVQLDKWHNDHELLFQGLQGSVLQTSFLPRWLKDSDGNSMDISGLLAGGDDQSVVNVPILDEMNTERMRVTYNQLSLLPKGHLPVLDGKTVNVEHYTDIFENGFQKMYAFILRHKAALMDEKSPLYAFQNQKVRFVFRATRVYATLLKKSYQPNYLRDGVDRSLQLDVLSRVFLKDKNCPLSWPLFFEEKRAMEQMDVPYFSAMTGEADLEITKKQKKESIFQQSGFEKVYEKLNFSGKNDMIIQSRFIRGALSARMARIESLKRTYKPVMQSASSDKVLFPNEVKGADFLSQVEAVTLARLIATNFRENAFHGKNGSVTWCSQMIRDSRFHFKKMDYGMYDGHSGMGLFFAALYRLTGDPSYRDFAFSALQLLRNELSVDGGKHMTERLGIGGFDGSGSIIYALAQMAEILETDDLLDDACILASALNEDAIANDSEWVVASGSAGALLALLKLYDKTGESRFLEKAVFCGKHLLLNRIKTDSGNRTWERRSKNGHSHIGFGFGSVGIASSLLRLYGQSGERSFLQAAKEEIDAETHFYREDNEKRLNASWCHGSAGIGLALLEGQESHDFSVSENRLRKLIQCSLIREPGEVDGVCCGNMGQVEWLTEAAQALSRTDLREAAIRKTTEVTTRFRTTGHWHLIPCEENFGFFQGLAGIGYTLLRLYHADKLPCILNLS